MWNLFERLTIGLVGILPKSWCDFLNNLLPDRQWQFQVFEGGKLRYLNCVKSPVHQLLYFQAHLADFERSIKKPWSIFLLHPRAAKPLEIKPDIFNSKISSNGLTKSLQAMIAKFDPNWEKNQYASSHWEDCSFDPHKQLHLRLFRDRDFEKLVLEKEVFTKFIPRQHR